MTTRSAFRFWAPAVLMGASSLTPMVLPAGGQAVQAATQSLLEKAHALEVRGRMDMASQTWQQVLLADPNNTEALGGLARAAKSSGNLPLANTYLDRLRAINPKDPEIARVETMGTQADHNEQLKQAGKLAQQGQYAQAMAVYRQVYGDTPPAGESALAFYETESATDEGRPHAIAGLRSLMAKNPADSRYQIALGRILTYNPQTRAEGRRLLAAHPADPQAVEALRQSLVWDAQNPATAGDIKAYLAKHPDAQLDTALRNLPQTGGGNGRPAPLTAEQRAAAAVNATRTAEDQAAYRLLNAKRLPEAEERFKAILQKSPDDANALAGMGYIRMQQANFAGAISYLVQAKEDGSKDPGLEAALVTSRFWNTMGEGAAALNENDLPTAEKDYRSALALRPASTEALEGLGGTLLKAQQPEAAAPVFAQFVKLKPSAAHAWRGLFLAQLGAGDAVRALQTERQVPPAARAELMRDPLFLRALSSSYSSVGRDADAQRVLRSALDLPFPADAKGLQAETQLQYASLLQQANHLDQAAGLYRQVLKNDPANVSAWQGLVRAEHAMNQDEQALETLEKMPPEVSAKAMRDAGFESTVASIYQTQKRLDLAQNILEQTLAQTGGAGQRVPVAVQIQLAGIYLQRNNPQQAFPLYQQILTQSPDRTEAWKGLLSALHSTGRDSEALAQVQQIPAATRAQLENDVDFLQTMGSVYNGLGQTAQAQTFLARVQAHYAQQHTLPPADVDVQDAWLLYNGGNDQGLYRQLLSLGGRADLSDEQRRTVQTIWANWAVRRANQAAAAGNNPHALAILNATARSFPDNPGVIKALASGYARAGMSKQAVLIWKAQDMKSASASDYKAAVGAALAADDQKDAETWLRFALDQYPKDADLLLLGARFEQARGDNNRAADYYRVALDAMPAADPGAELAQELGRPAPVAQLPTAKAGTDLATLLAPGAAEPGGGGAMAPPPATRPYLPSAGSAYGTAPIALPGGMSTQPMSGQEPDPVLNSGPAVPSYMASPTRRPRTPATGTQKTRLRDYVPQAAAGELLPADATALPASVASIAFAERDTKGLPLREGSGLTLTPALYQQQQIMRLTAAAFSEGAHSGGGISVYPIEQAQAPQVTQPFPATSPQHSRRSQPLTAEPVQPAAQQVTQPTSTTSKTEEVYGPYVPYKPPTASAQPGNTIPQPEGMDTLPRAHYVPNARIPAATSRKPDSGAANGAAMRRRQADPPRTGESKPPAEEYTTPVTDAVQYSTSPAAAQNNGQAGQGTANPAPRAGTSSSSSAVPAQTGDSYGQQYPQPGSARTATRGRARAVTRRTPAVQETQQTVTPGLSYPGIAQPLGAQPYPTIGPSYPLGTPPTDADLMARRVPPLRGRYYTGEVLAPTVPLTQRQQAERDLATLEASYSGWIGGTGSARYRSGTVGLDRLTDLETTFEASATVGNHVRFSVVPRAVFLNSGVLDTTQYQGATTGVPVLGTLPANAINAPSQQFASGVGGELQVSGRNFALAAGYTPYEFLVRNVTGRVLFKPSQHVTLYANRDAVTETQLSYAGLRDPGSTTPGFGGNIWGGVVATGGGLRFDLGDERTGFYLTADGADLTGFHVLENTKFEGSMGAYFLAHSFRNVGRLNVGASLFGMHYAHNERGLTYGLGGYFSPEAYFLASVPITFIGRYGNSFHYSIAGSVGVQTFQEDSALFFPLDRGIQSVFSAPCTPAQTAAHTCAQFNVNSNTGGNYGLNAEGAYRIAEHWYAGGFLSANNTNNYNTITGGFFVRYLFRPQFGTEDYPTGLFPVDGFRPLRVP